MFVVFFPASSVGLLVATAGLPLEILVNMRPWRGPGAAYWRLFDNDDDNDDPHQRGEGAEERPRGGAPSLCFGVPL